MRSVDKGSSPLGVDGAPLVFEHYSDAAPHLKARLGRFCSYCERTIPVNLAVEHKRPKQKYPELDREWSNLLLACGNCNSCKGEREPVGGDPAFPDEVDTGAMYTYLPSGKIKPKDGLNELDSARAAAMLNLLGLDRPPNFGGPSDHRCVDRLEVWRKAEQSLLDLAALDFDAMRRRIVDTAQSSGGYSIWMTVFTGNTDMSARLTSIHPGTRSAANVL